MDTTGAKVRETTMFQWLVQKGNQSQDRPPKSQDGLPKVDTRVTREGNNKDISAAGTVEGPKLYPGMLKELNGTDVFWGHVPSS